jgi:hypothetical protein
MREPSGEKMGASLKEGHYLAMKYLFEMIGLFPATASEKMETQDSLAKNLLSHLGIAEAETQQSIVTKG